MSDEGEMRESLLPTKPSEEARLAAAAAAAAAAEAAAAEAK